MFFPGQVSNRMVCPTALLPIFFAIFSDTNTYIGCDNTFFAFPAIIGRGNTSNKQLSAIMKVPGKSLFILL
jgi:hypothetical protein